MNKKQMILLGFGFYLISFMAGLLCNLASVNNYPLEIIALAALIADGIILGVFALVEGFHRLYKKLGD